MELLAIFLKHTLNGPDLLAFAYVPSSTWGAVLSFLILSNSYPSAKSYSNGTSSLKVPKYCPVQK